MALVKCKECGGEVSKIAKSCPKCGAPVKKKGIGCGSLIIALIVLFVLFLVLGAILSHQESKETEKITRQREEAQKQAEVAFDKNINQHYMHLKKLILENSLDDAVKLLDNFNKYGQINYKDVQNINKAVRTNYNLKKLEGISKNNTKERLDIYKKLVVINPENTSYISQRDRYQKVFTEQEIKRRNAERKATEERRKTEERNARIEEHFSPWDGSHRNLVNLIKESMNDPDSYKHVKTVYSDHGEYLMVKTTFRGKNAFGGTVVNFVLAKVDLDGNILEIIEQGS